MSMDLSWIKQQDLAVVILYKKLQALFRVFFFFFAFLRSYFEFRLKNLTCDLSMQKVLNEVKKRFPTSRLCLSILF